MDHRRAFLQSIIEAPDDDAPRLVFADWLHDEGDEARAEFIRAQIALARLPADDARRPQLAAREKALLGEHGWDWAGELGEAISEWQYRRGFIERVVTSLESPRLDVAALMAKAPIRHIRDQDNPLGLGFTVKELPQLERLVGLEFWNIELVENDDLATLLSSPHLANLRSFVFCRFSQSEWMGEDVLVDAMHSPHRRNLRELGVSNASAPLLLAIAGSEHLRNLRVLHIPFADALLPVAMRALVESPNLSHLEELNVAGTNASLDNWDELLASQLLGRLKRLRIAKARVPSRYRTALDRPGLIVDTQTEFDYPKQAGRWSGQTWAGWQEKHIAEMAPFLQARDAVGLELAFRSKCVRFAGEDAARLVDSLDFIAYRHRLQSFIEEASATVPEGGAILLVFSGRSGEATLTILASPDIHDEQHGGSRTRSYSPVARPGPPCTFPEFVTLWDQLCPVGLKPQGGRLYLHARAAAAFLRCLRDSPITACYETSEPEMLFRL